MPVYPATPSDSNMPTTSSALGVLPFFHCSNKAMSVTSKKADKSTTPHIMIELGLFNNPKKRTGFASPARASTISISVPMATASKAIRRPAVLSFVFVVLFHPMKHDKTNAPAPKPAKKRYSAIIQSQITSITPSTAS